MNEVQRRRGPRQQAHLRSLPDVLSPEVRCPRAGNALYVFTLPAC